MGSRPEWLKAFNRGFVLTILGALWLLYNRRILEGVVEAIAVFLILMGLKAMIEAVAVRGSEGRAS
ncbi:MAG: hypothetical protein DRK00_04805 [Thermoprotei archaeon]|nr:MAG: hypothetical protein DRK00_04805 [Thermoprotei archaeon]